MQDLASRRVVFIGDPHARIREDFLRILRFFRFHAEYGTGPLDASGLAAAIAGRSGLAVLSRERVRSELLKLLRADRGVEVLGEVSDSGVMQLLIGGVVEIGRLARTIRFEREAGLDPDPIRRLAALAVATREDADRLREWLRLANAEHERLLAFAAVLARLRSIGGSLDATDIRRLVVEHGVGRLARRACSRRWRTEARPR
jgi:poly(A) polymerase